MENGASNPDPRPRSAVSAGVGLSGLVGLLIWTAFARMYGMAGPLSALVALIACGVPMVLWSLLVDKVHRNPTTGIDWDNPPRPLKDVLDTSIVKIAGLWAVWGAIGCLYCIGRWYWANPYLFSMQLFAVAVVPMVVLSVPYVLWIDRRLKDPRDGAWHFGQWLIGRTDEVDREVIYDFLRSWAIKGFFLAFMMAGLPGNWEHTISASADAILASPGQLAMWLIGIMFTIDMSLASVGYILTFKVLDAHIRSANPYAAAWMAALICYPPFILMSGALDYFPATHGPDGWSVWLRDWPVLLALNGAWLVFLTGIYAWATVAFGMRFSNLTHRGILTHGPYAWSKHPAYLSKNLFWWCAVLPFFVTNGNLVDAVRNTALLAVVSGIYYWRARTEEKHLSEDPAYREYAEWMHRHGRIPRLIRWIAGVPGPAARPAPAQEPAPAE
jgi:protein-S-isoprenylcysteine O-methyltransferase Ste14